MDVCQISASTAVMAITKRSISGGPQRGSKTKSVFAKFVTAITGSG